MDIFSIFTLLGGLAFFLYGMHVMSTGLEKLAGGRLERTLKKFTSNPFKSLALGAGITIAIQSSSALTVMLVGLVNSGIMELGQTVGVIMGSNLGTTLTAWLLSLSGIESGNFFIRLLKPTSFSPIIALIGIILIMGSKSNKKKDVGSILVGFAVLMFGMNVMSDSVSPLADMPEFTSILTAFSNPLLGVLIGALFTGIIQSSAASVGVLQALSLTGSISYGMALPIVMGQNIGTCVTALLSSIGVNKNAKRVAVVHVYFNLIGTIVIMAVFYGLNAFLHFDFIDKAVNPFGVAVMHSLFNVITTVVLFPFSRQLEKLTRLTIPDKSSKEKYELIDERLLNTPAFAIAECKNITAQMAELSKETILTALELMKKYSSKKADSITQSEIKIDKYEDTLSTFLVKLSGRELSDKDSNEVFKLLHTIGDFERIGDHAVNLLRVADEIHQKDIHFSKEAKSELEVLSAAIVEIMDITTKCFIEGDTALAAKVEPLEQVIDALAAELKTRHVTRLQNNQCTIEMGFVFSDILNNYERVSDHCSNIAVCLIQIDDSHAFDTHSYLDEVKTSGQPEFVRAFDNYSQKYMLPQ